jgi:arabinose-5-phosphate isomerase
MNPVNWLDRAREVLEIEEDAVRSAREHLSSAFTQALEILASCNGRIIITGVGKSGIIGMKIASTFCSVGAPASFLHPVDALHGDLGLLRSGDVIIAISNSGKTDELLAVIPLVKKRGVQVISLTGAAGSPLAELADAVLDCQVPREACALNIVPTASTTAVLALGDALAVCLMEKKKLSAEDFHRNHPGGSLGRRLSLRAADIMRGENLPLVRIDADFTEALAVLDRVHFGAVLVTGEAGRLAGILTDGDIRKLLARGLADRKTSVAEVMNPRPLSVRRETSAAELLEIMEEKLITVLPVVDEDNAVIGIAHLHDILGRGTLHFSA